MIVILFIILLLIVVTINSASNDNVIATIRLAFGVMIYHRNDNTIEETIDCFMRLINVIYNERHVYVLHIDIKSDPIIINTLNEFCNQRSNCYTISSRNVAWAGASISEMMLAIMQKAYEVDDNNNNNKWDYFMLMGHDTLPMVTLNYMEQFLIDSLTTSNDSSEYKGKNYIYCWQVSGHNFFGQWEDNTWRLEIPVIDTMDGHLIEEILSVSYNGHNHNHYHPRRYPLAGIDFRKSLQHCVLTRDFVKYAIYSSEARRVFLFLANVKNSDENILPTILFTNPSLAATATCNNTLHFNHWIRPGGSWHPEVLGLEHLPLLLSQTQKLFVRKINSQKSTELTTVLARIRNEYYNDYDCNDVDNALINKRHMIEQLTWIIPVAKDYIFKNYHDYDDNTKSTIDAYFDNYRSCSNNNDHNNNERNDNQLQCEESIHDVLNLLDNIRKGFRLIIVIIILPLLFLLLSFNFILLRL